MPLSASVRASSTCAFRRISTAIGLPAHIGAPVRHSPVYWKRPAGAARARPAASPPCPIAAELPRRRPWDRNTPGFRIVRIFPWSRQHRCWDSRPERDHHEADHPSARIIACRFASFAISVARLCCQTREIGESLSRGITGPPGPGGLGPDWQNGARARPTAWQGTGRVVPSCRVVLADGRGGRSRGKGEWGRSECWTKQKS
jgi:hypothetical protein